MGFRIGGAVLAAAWLAAPGWTAAAPGGAPRPNFLFITADDMNYDTPGFTGGPVPGITPHLDRLASEGLWFRHAHVTVAVCQPSRECLMTGRYPHRNGATGFYPVRPGVPTLQESLKAGGYHLGILGKVIHLAPPAKFPWDYQYDAKDLGNGRDPALYFQRAREFLRQARDAGKPFFLMANSHDPHRPYAGSEGGRKGGKAAGRHSYPDPDRVYRPEEVRVHGFIPDLPETRREAAQYYSSSRRCDQTVGEILRALKEEKFEDSTLVMFLSDNGVALPFAKSNCYLASTRTPWLVRWPGRMKPGTVDAEHMISGIDYMPTILEAAGLPAPKGMDGRSFLPLLAGEKQDGRDRVFTCYDETSGRRQYPMRCLQTPRLGYIFNGWAGGPLAYRAEPMSGLTFPAMQKAAGSDPAVAARVELLLHRVLEELYDFEKDPDGLRNLAGDSKYRPDLERMRREMREWMERVGDPRLEDFLRTASSR